MDTLNVASLTMGSSAGLGSLAQTQQSVSAARQAGNSASQATLNDDEAKARDAAEQFEALLIHNMLKSMRKTTMAENTSNQRAIYDDMLDKSLADSMIEAGGLGIAEQLMHQLHDPNRERKSTQQSPERQAPLTQDRLRLRELAGNITANSDEFIPRDYDSSVSDSSVSRSNASIESAPDRLKMLSGLWGRPGDADSDKQHTRGEFINELAPYARQSAQRLGTSSSAVLAIAALETGWGRSLPTDSSGESSHNYFGIKAVASNERYTQNLTTEFVNGQPKQIEARFKTYDSAADSVAGFADFLLQNPRYSTALSHAGDPERFIRELHDAGYATDPRYAEKAIAVMRQVEQHKAQQ